MEKKYNILYVDDELDNLVAFRAVFRRHYTIYSAQSGEEAIEMLRNQKIDLIISDQRMPKMTGVELIEQVRIEYPDMIRMILTGYSDVQAIVDAINKGKIYYYITKPWNVEELKVIMDNALETYSLRLKNRELEAVKHQLELKAAQQEKASLQSQFEILKNQINPHFLFNSMNILSSLISTNPQAAIHFTNQFSKVYRRLLELRGQQLITLGQELEFVESYIYLQKMRFTENLQIHYNIPNEYHKDCLPPFTLQILVENAIKHNIISQNQPLQISIEAKNHQLKVSNNLQLRGSRPISTKIGLENLRARYELITSVPVSFSKNGNEYVAVVPLIPEG